MWEEREEENECFSENYIACFQFVTCLLWISIHTSESLHAFVIIYGISVAATRHGPVVFSEKILFCTLLDCKFSLYFFETMKCPLKLNFPLNCRIFRETSDF